ncbi:MAG: CoA pyrophosphatase [Prolixibacteraceae bacterium]|nr:CoA pyrophosphatase [Prolixibacteraceae bacterium]
MILNAENIKKALDKKLPGSFSHRKMLPPNRKLFVPNEENNIKHSSVHLLLFADNQELTACLIKRTTHMKHHAGQIALPGGRIEKGETHLETALRETWEEIGISPEQIQILGSLSELYVEISRFLIHPFVGWLERKPQFTIDRNEVEKTILFPLLKFKNSIDRIELESFTGKLNVPCISFNGEIIWGATAMIVSEFYDVLERSNIIRK